MIDSVPTNVLQNCTIGVISRYPKLLDGDATDISTYNRSNVISVLSDTFEKFTGVYSDRTLQLQFK